MYRTSGVMTCLSAVEHKSTLHHIVITLLLFTQLSPEFFMFLSVLFFRKDFADETSQMPPSKMPHVA